MRSKSTLDSLKEELERSFMDKAENYVLTNSKDGGDVISLFHSMEVPKDSFNADHRPIELIEDEKLDSVNIDIYKEKIKLYVEKVG
jgi:hypothetical protein